MDFTLANTGCGQAFKYSKLVFSSIEDDKNKTTEWQAGCTLQAGGRVWDPYALGSLQESVKCLIEAK